jgi:peptide chain release factor subunit 1
VITSFGFDELLGLCKEDKDPIGCVVISGENASFYTLTATITLNFSMDVNLPNKHRRGGQSQKRFERLTKEARHNYISKVIEHLHFVYSSTTPLILAGASHLKNKLADRIGNKNKILQIVDVQYDKRAGLNEVIHKCGHLIESLGLEKEQKAIDKFMNYVVNNSNMVCYGELCDANGCSQSLGELHHANGVVDYYLENGIVETLLVESSKLTQELQKQCECNGTEIVVITDMLSEGRQLVKAFGSIVGILRYPVVRYEEDSEGDSEYDY